METTKREIIYIEREEEKFFKQCTSAKTVTLIACISCETDCA